MSQNQSPNRQTWAVVIGVAILVAALMWIANAIVAHNRLQNCIDSGRHDCLPNLAGSGG